MTRAFFEASVMLHNFGEVVATVGIFVALASSPLSLVSMIMQAPQLVLTLFAFLFLKEKGLASNVLAPLRWGLPVC